MDLINNVAVFPVLSGPVTANLDAVLDVDDKNTYTGILQPFLHWNSLPYIVN